MNVQETNKFSQRKTDPQDLSFHLLSLIGTQKGIVRRRMEPPIVPLAAKDLRIESKMEK